MYAQSLFEQAHNGRERLARAHLRPLLRPDLHGAFQQALFAVFSRISVPLIGVGGVSSAETAIAKIEAGATLIQLYSALTYRGINLVNEIKRGLSEYLWINSQPSHEILIGRTAHKWQGRFAK